MINILLKVESRFIVNRKKLRASVAEFLSKRVRRDAEISISIAGNRKMRQLNRDYKNLDKYTNVLSFPLHESRKINNKKSSFSPQHSSPDDVLRLGDVIVSYPEAVKESAKLHKMVDDRIFELVEHGIKHLLGIHHE